MPGRSIGLNPTFPLEPSADEMRSLVDQAMQHIIAHIDSLPDQPAAHTEGGAELATQFQLCRTRLFSLRARWRYFSCRSG